MGIWQVVQHAMDMHTVACKTGQDVFTTLSGRLLGGTPSHAAPRTLLFRPVDMGAVECRPPNTTVAADGTFDAYCRISTPAVGTRSWLVTACDAEGPLPQRQLMHRWLLTVAATAPEISARYEALGLPNDRQKRMKIKVTNPESARHSTVDQVVACFNAAHCHCTHTGDGRKVLSVVSDQPHIAWPLNNRLALTAGGSGFLEIVFEPQPTGAACLHFGLSLSQLTIYLLV
eukprot:SAG31_NODE_1670_length_7567_cov_13.084360_3_plen_230_part_00